MNDVQFDIYRIQDILNKPKHEIETEKGTTIAESLFDEFEKNLNDLSLVSVMSKKISTHGLSPAFLSDYGASLEQFGISGSQETVTASLEGIGFRIMQTLKNIIVKLITFFRNSTFLIRMTDVNELLMKQMSALISEKEWKYTSVNTAAFKSASGYGFEYEKFIELMNGVRDLVDKLRVINPTSIEGGLVTDILRPYLLRLGFTFDPRLTKPDFTSIYREIVYADFRWDPTRVHNTTAVLFNKILVSNLPIVKLRNTATMELAKANGYLRDPDLAEEKRADLMRIVSNCRALRMIIISVSMTTSMLIRQWISMVRKFEFA